MNCTFHGEDVRIMIAWTPDKGEFKACNECFICSLKDLHEREQLILEAKADEWQDGKEAKEDCGK